MQFEDVIRARRMVRSYRAEPIDSDIVDHLLELASRAPSAGNTAGRHFVVLDTPDTVEAYWNTTLPPERRAAFPWPGLLRAPVLVLPCGDAGAYLQRYAEPDKEASGLGRSTDDWPIPYWHVDTAMATMTLLHAAVDAGLGALFFGLFENERAICDLLGIPERVRPIGTVALGWPDDADRPSASALRGRPSMNEIVHRGRW